MRKNDDINFLAMVGASAVGASVGFLLGLLFAPKKGTELREDIIFTGKDLVDKAKNRKCKFFNEEDFDDYEEDFDDDLDIYDLEEHENKKEKKDEEKKEEKDEDIKLN